MGKAAARHEGQAFKAGQVGDASKQNQFSTYPQMVRIFETLHMYPLRIICIHACKTYQ